MALRLMTSFTLEILKGNNATSGYMLDKQAQFDATQVATISGGVIPRGRTVHLAPDEQWELGVGDQDLAFWLLSNSDDPDVTNPGGDPTTEYGAWSPAMSKKMQAVCALGAVELETTEFNTALTYAPGQWLTAPVSDGVAANMLSTAGKLTNASVKPYSHNVVGIVSKNQSPSSPKNAHGTFMLRFYPCYLPKITGIAEPAWAS